MDQKSNIEYPPGALLPRDAEGKINCCNIDFFYEERGRKIFSDFNLEIPKGNTLAVVGSTGTGKTSLINLFLRLYDVNGGDIYIDNKNIKSFHPKFRKLFAVVPQDIDIFNKDILHNVRYGCNHVSERDVEKALRVSNFSSALGSKDFPDGIYTKIGEGGKDLSGGERQRIAIARAYLALTMGGAKFLILDEATSNLDANTEKDVREVINNIKKEMDFTTIIITHRLSMVKYADEIIFFDLFFFVFWFILVVSLMFFGFKVFYPFGNCPFDHFHIFRVDFRIFLRMQLGVILYNFFDYFQINNVFPGYVFEFFF